MNKKNIILLCVIAAICSCLIILISIQQASSRTGSKAFDEAVKNGYSGTIEEWLAALVGETVASEQQEKISAYDLACEKGYSGSFNTWMLSLTKTTTDDVNTAAYELMKEKGYSGSLTQWLTSLVTSPEKLGHGNGGTKTEYEYACEYGFKGTFIEWLVSLVSVEPQ